MSKIVNYGRWPVAVLFALPGLAILSGAVASGVSTIRDGLGTLYPVYFDLLESAAFLLCSWGLARMRNWAYWWAMAICSLEVIVVVALFLAPGKAFHALSIVIAGMHFESWFIVIPWVIPCVCLVWLLLPSVRAQYLQKESAA
jgi:hypothetical protein